MKNFTLKRKVVRHETYEVQAESFEQARRKWKEFMREPIADDEIVDVGTMQYTGEAE